MNVAVAAVAAAVVVAVRLLRCCEYWQHCWCWCYWFCGVASEMSSMFDWTIPLIDNCCWIKQLQLQLMRLLDMTTLSFQTELSYC